MSKYRVLPEKIGNSQNERKFVGTFRSKAKQTVSLPRTRSKKR